MYQVHIDPRQTALLIIDVQNDYLHENGYLARRGADNAAMRSIVPVIERLIAQARESGVPVVFVKKVVTDEDFPNEAWLNRPNAGRRDAQLVRKGTWGAELYRLIPEPGDVVIEKSRYSAFDRTNLDEKLRGMNVKSLVLTGLATNVCVESTARHAWSLDYNVTLARDGCASPNPALGMASLATMEAYFGWVMDSQDIIEYWKQTEQE